MKNDKQVDVTTRNSSLPVKRETTLRLKASPVADIYETTDAFVVDLDLPGTAKEGIEVLVDSGALVVRGTVNARTHTEGRVIHREIGWNAYERTFKIGPGIDREHITAQFSDGVLSINLPKTESSKARQIAIT